MNSTAGLHRDVLLLRDHLKAHSGAGELQVAAYVAMWIRPWMARALVKRGTFFPGQPATIRAMHTSDCHDNSLELARGDSRMTLWSGMALNGGLWRVHSWVRGPRGGLIETTVPRESYFGIELKRHSGEARRWFAALSSSPKSLARNSKAASPK